MKIIKRSGQEAVFDEEKIINAVRKANKEVNEISRISEEDIKALADSVTEECAHMGRSVNVEEIQDMVEDRLMDKKAFGPRAQIHYLSLFPRARPQGEHHRRADSHAHRMQ